jgi:hypothetical protein
MTGVAITTAIAGLEYISSAVRIKRTARLTYTLAYPAA